MATKRINKDGSETHVMSKHDVESALTYLNNMGIHATASPSPTERGKYVIDWTDGRHRPEKLTAREVWILVRGMRVGIAKKGQR